MRDDKGTGHNKRVATAIYLTDEQREMVANNHNLIYGFLRDYHLNHDDFYGAAAIGLCKAAFFFKPSPSTFSHWAYKCMFNEYSHEVRANRADKRSGEVISLDEIGDYIENNTRVEQQSITNVMCQDIDQYVDHVATPAQKTVYRKFRQGYKDVEIAAQMGISKYAVSRAKRTIFNRVRVYFKDMCA